MVHECLFLAFAIHSFMFLCMILMTRIDHQYPILSKTMLFNVFLSYDNITETTFLMNCIRRLPIYPNINVVITLDSYLVLSSLGLDSCSIIARSGLLFYHLAV